MRQTMLTLRRRRRLLLALCLFLVTAVLAQQGTQPPELFSAVMQRISSQPEFRERVLRGMREIPKVGEFLSPDLLKRLRVLILGKQWQRVDHFPALPVVALNHSVDATIRLAGKAATPLKPGDLLDTGGYSLERSEAIDLDHPVTTPTYAEDPATAQRQIGFNLTMGDGPDPSLAPMHAQSRQLAGVLNRLAMNLPGKPRTTATFNGQSLEDGSALLAALAASGHHISITDDLYFANFGHLHDAGREVMMPFWIDTQIAVPASTRSLLLPVSHSEQELHVRGPVWNADVSFYFGIDGKAEFRTMDSLNQSWVMHRAAFTYTNQHQIGQVIDLLSAALRVYYQVRMAHPELPFGGYYRLGVCQDVGAVVERVMEGRVLLFPMTHDRAYFPVHAFADPRDLQFVTNFAAIPSDRGGGLPPIDRVLGALPTTQYDSIVIPGLASDLHRVAAARSLGLLQRTHPLLTLLVIVTSAILLLGLAAWWLVRHWRKRSSR